MALADHARRFAAYRVAPGLRERDRARVVGRTLMRAPGEMEFIAPELPQKFGRHLVRTHRNATWASGWLGTGDQARIDAQGHLPRHGEPRGRHARGAALRPRSLR